MPTDRNEYAGVLPVKDGKLRLPEKYREATQFVVRQRTITQDVASGQFLEFAIWHDGDPDRGVQNEHLAADEVELKLYGEPPERYKVRGGGHP
jgi:hypothetical protein